VILLLCVLVGAPLAGARAQGTPEPGTPAAVEALFEIMTPEERVGQLFLVTFQGTDMGNTSRIYDLIVNQHVGGMVLLVGNDNFVAAPDTAAAARDLSRGLQRLEWTSTLRPPSDPITGKPESRAYVPLFIASIQDGDGAPGDQILTGLTPLPSPMALGATWAPELAREVGVISGRELAALGINMYFGPSLDVLENPNTMSANDLGASVFGGDPFWVSLMGSAYLNGLHEGSGNRLLVIPKFFPGRGSSDRLGDEEVATVRKSLEELKQIELAPFFAVTGGAPEPEGSRADGLLLSHIRYQGFQGNIRATTKPVSFDAQALASILSLPDLATWREAGGLIVSDNLGTNAVRHFYSTGTEFPARTVARDAFVAGNDLLYLGNIVASDAPDNYTTVLDIIGFFARKYREDPGFAQRVDAAVLRVLSLKYRLYGRFDLTTVLAETREETDADVAQQITYEVASRAATLLSPAPQDFAALLQTPPRLRDRIVFFTDASTARQCSTCAEVPGLAVEALQRAVIGLYGPEAGNQTSSFRLSRTHERCNQLRGGEPAFSGGGPDFRTVGRVLAGGQFQRAGTHHQQLPGGGAGSAARQARHPVRLWRADVSGCDRCLAADGVLLPVQQAAGVHRSGCTTAVPRDHAGGRLASVGAGSGIRPEVDDSSGPRPDHHVGDRPSGQCPRAGHAGATPCRCSRSGHHRRPHWNDHDNNGHPVPDGPW
jgi:beta-N-acetylhexosaminidase